MAITRKDTRLLVGAAGAVIAAGLVILVMLLALTSRGGGSDGQLYDQPVPFGDAKALRRDIEAEGPINYAGSTGDSGFWVTLEDGQLVAVLVRQPGRGDCHVRWAESKGGFVDCDDERLEVAELARYRTEVPDRGTNKGKLVVDLTEVVPAPRAPGGPN
ncbi:MAG: hypothetical protein FJW88_07000 [Actinobacteria bacterium]|nr:hypothetical protein [Actinomycetota bacterium]